VPHGLANTLHVRALRGYLRNARTYVVHGRRRTRVLRIRTHTHAQPARSILSGGGATGEAVQARPVELLQPLIGQEEKAEREDERSHERVSLGPPEKNAQ
jgi:hypothetical protein